MEQRVLVLCEHCSGRFRVRAENIGRRARCPKCQRVFRMKPPQEQSLDDTVCGWLEDAPADETPTQKPSGVSLSDVLSGTTAGLKVVSSGDSYVGMNPPSSAHTPSATASGTKKLSLRQIDAMGAYIQFDASLLADAVFRGSMPVKCANCLSKEGLLLHVVSWIDRRQYGAGRQDSMTGRACLDMEQFAGHDTQAILGMLPEDSSLRIPYSLPFPYYVCKHCSPMGLVTAYVASGANPSMDRCWLSIFNLRYAAEFFEAVDGNEDDDARRLRKHARSMSHDRWSRFPLPVRNRLEQWYEARPGEKFVEYFPDVDFSRSESGQAGVILTNQRMVYHKFAALREYALDQEVKVSCQQDGDTYKVCFEHPGTGRSITRLDDRSVSALRAELTHVRSQFTFD